MLLGAGAFLAGSGARSADASYALYAASKASYDERKQTGYVPVATSDVASLAEIQAQIKMKRPPSANKAPKAKKYCAGQTAAVSGLMENVCANSDVAVLGSTKSDQSNTRIDAFGNMDIGVYGSQELDADLARLAAAQKAGKASSSAAAAAAANAAFR